jgi:uncharacterized protein DUF3800
MERLPAFYRVIEKYVVTSISCRINLADFERAHARAMEWALARNWEPDFASWKNPFFYTFRCLIDHFHGGREKMEALVPLTEKVEFIFDNQGEKAAILAAWDDYIALRDGAVRGYYGTHPRFEDDQDFLPLQAADLWAWWVREWYEHDQQSALPAKMEAFDFGGWRGKPRRVIWIHYTEDDILTVLQSLATINAEMARQITSPS